jgi:hypothetical protein
VCRDRPRTLNELKTAIAAYIRNISQGDLQKVFGSKIKHKFEPKRDEIRGEWRKLHNEELYDLYCTPKIVRVWGGGVKSRRMR